MLDEEIKQQLNSLFGELKFQTELIYARSSHPQQAELVNLLESIAHCSDKITAREEPSKDLDTPSFQINVNGKSTGIHFRAIPTGHEFATLILGILNSNGLGKLPDSALTERIQNISGPIKLKTYMSLSCEVCPDVIQIINQVAILHGNFIHEIIDGNLDQDEIQRLKIAGVPAVFARDLLLHSGRISLGEFIDKLTQHYGERQQIKAQDLGRFDVVVVGGGPAGVSAAIYSARKGQKTAIIAEKIGGQVNDTKGIENLISVIYTEGPNLSSQLLEHLKSYPIEILENRKVEKLNLDLIELNTRETLSTSSIIIATGARWRELGIPGEKEYIGRGVAFCPHCDGPFFKNKKVAVVGGGNSGVEAAIDLAGLCSQVILFEYLDQLKADQVLIDKLYSLPNVKVILQAKTTEVKGDGTNVTALSYESTVDHIEKSEKVDGIFVQIGLSPNSSFAKNIVSTNNRGEIIVDDKGRTSAKGIYAAGDVSTTPYKQIIIAMGEGAKVALAAFEDKMRMSPT